MGGASDDLVAIRLRLQGGRVVAAELGEVAAAQKAVGAASTTAAAQTARGTSGIRNSIKSVLTNSMKLRAVGRTMTYGLTLPIIGAGYYAIKTAAEFDTSMAQVQAATRAPSGTMDELRKLAIQMGADTVFSANEAAQAMLELAKGGLTPAQIRAGALDASLKLAAAGGIELADAGNQITRSMNTFGLPASQAIRIANALAGAAQASSADLSDMSLAMSQAGQSANAAGFTINETAGILGAFADAGIIGSDAGTSLKVMLQRLIPQSADAASAMKQYGLDFFDANGHMKSATQIAGILQKGLGGLTQEQRSAAMATIFGSDATRAATILMNQGAGGLAKYIKATQDHGAAQRMADARMKGLSGSLETLKGSIETSALAFGEALKPAIIAVAGVLTTLANAFTGLPPQAQTVIAVFALLLAMLGPMIFLLGTLAAAATILGVSLGALLLAIGIAVAIVAVVVIFVVLYEKVRAFHNAVDAVWGFIKAHWPLLVAPLMLVIGPLILIATHFRQVRQIAGAVFNWIKGAAGSVAGAVKSAFGSVAGAVGSAFRSVVNGVIDAINWLIRAFNAVFDRSIDPPGPGPAFHGIHLDEIGHIGGGGGRSALPKGVHGPIGAGQLGLLDFSGGPLLLGETGPELGWLPKGASLMPAGPTRRWTGQEPEVRGSRALAGRGIGGRTIVKQPLVFKIKAKPVAEAVVTLQDDEEARQ